MSAPPSVSTYDEQAASKMGTTNCILKSVVTLIFLSQAILLVQLHNYPFQNSSFTEFAPPTHEDADDNKLTPIDDVGEKKLMPTETALAGNEDTPAEIVNTQRIVILAGPHKTGSSSVQHNLCQWTTSTTNHSTSRNSFDHNNTHSHFLTRWAWPVPPIILRADFEKPDKAFYPMMEALQHPNKKLKSRTIFQHHNTNKVVKLYRESIEEYWAKGYNIVFGTEAMDLIVKLPSRGDKLLQGISDRILPKSSADDVVTVVIVYRYKISHLVSIWHQSNYEKKKHQSFYDWITTTQNTLGAVDTLGMVEMILEKTRWKIALVDLDGVIEEKWDLSNLVACRVMNVECKGKRLVQLGQTDPAIKNIRKNETPPNVNSEALDEMHKRMMAFDCKYENMIKNARKNESTRLEIFHPHGLDKVMTFCQSLQNEKKPKGREQMKQGLVKIALDHGENDE